jgi:opacity protein-like surface antigen
MKRILSLLSAALFVVAVLAAPGAAAIKLSFKLNGGAAMLLNGAGDLEKFRKGEEAYAADWAEGDIYSSTFNWKKLSLASEFGGEVILRLSPRLGVGIGAGYIGVGRKGDYSLNYHDTWNASGGIFDEKEDSKTAHDFSGSAVPILLNFHYQIPLSPRFNLIGYAGIGYYLGKFNHDYNYTANYLLTYTSTIYWNQKGTVDITYTQKSKATCNKIGFQGGVGLEMLLTPFISVGLEFTGRMVNFSDWKGDWEYDYSSRTRYWHEYLGWYSDSTTKFDDTESGSLWYWDWSWSYNSKDYASLGIREEKPSGSTVKNVRPAEINLNRIGALLSVRFHFDI